MTTRVNVGREELDRLVMTRRFRTLLTTVARPPYQTIFLAAVILFVPTSFLAQTPRQSSPIDSMGADKSSPHDEQRPSNPIEDEMRAKRAIKFAENEHKENLDRAREVVSKLEALEKVQIANLTFRGEAPRPQRQ